MITSLYGELTVLGFIGLTLFIVGQLKLMEEVSEEVFGEGEFIGELCESVTWCYSWLCLSSRRWSLGHPGREHHCFRLEALGVGYLGRVSCSGV